MSYKLVGMILLTLFIAAMASVTTLSTADDLSYVDLPSENMTINIEGYYSAQDGGGHQRVFSLADDGSGIPHENGYWNIAPHYNEVSTLWFGLKGDSTSEDSANLYQAFNYGKKLISPAGKTYLIDHSIALDNSIDIDFNNSTIKCSDSFSLTEHNFVMLRNWDFKLEKEINHYVYDDSGLVIGIINKAQNKYSNNGRFWEWKITRTIFDGSESELQCLDDSIRNIVAVYITTSNVNVNSCTFKNMPGDGTSANCALGIIEKTSTPQNIYFQNNIVTDCGQTGGKFGGLFSQGANNYVHNNVFKNLTDSPIAFNGPKADNSIITGNSIINQLGDGVAFEDGADNAVVANNYIDDFGTSGVNVKKFETAQSTEDGQISENITITNNTIKNGKFSTSRSVEGVHITGKNISVTNNEILNIPHYSIKIKRPDSDIIDTIYGNSGITINGDEIKVLSNDVDVTTYALKMRGTNFKIHNNTLISKGVTGIQSYGGVHSVDIRRNTINSNWQCLKVNSGPIGGFTFKKDNILTKTEWSLPLIEYPASGFGTTLNGRLSSNKILCDDDGIKRQILEKDSTFYIPPKGAATLIFNDARPWAVSDHKVSKISVLSGPFTVDDPNISRTHYWANAYQTVVITLTNSLNSAIKIDKVLLELEGTRIEG